MSLFWRVFATNAGVLVVAGAILSLSPASVPSPTSISKIAVLLVGLTVMLVVNALLLRRAFSPLERLTALMRRVDPLRPGERIPVYSSDAEVVELTHAFNQMLDRLELERRESAGSMLAGQEAERSRLARELHDEISQSLTALLLQLGRTAKIAPSELAAELASAEQAARASLEEVQRIVRELRPEALDDLGLASALAVLTDRMSEQTGLRIVRNVRTSDLPVLSPEEELAVYRIAQESLTNVVKHAHASEAVLELERTSSGAVMRVRDNGRGRDGRWSEGRGIRGMRERAILIDAELSVNSPPGSGVEVRLNLPVRQAER